MKEAVRSVPEDVQERLANLSPEQRRLFQQLVRERSALSPSALQRRRATEAPLSFGQERLWFINQLEPEDTAYHLHMHLPLPPGLNVGIWKRAWHVVVQRHEMLRTRFIAVDAVPRQSVLPDVAIEIAEIDLRALEPEERWSEARRVAAAQAGAPFDLTQPPLFRLCLLRLPEQYVSVMTVHHILADGWSIDVLMTELDSAYSALCAGKTVALPALPVQYSDFALWQREHFTGDRLEPLLGYWRQTLDGMPPLQLPTDSVRPSAFSGRAGAQAVLLPGELEEQIRRQAKAMAVTPFMWFLTAFCALLHRYTGQEDLVLGTPVAHRVFPEVEPLIGFFLNTILLRVRLAGGQTFRQALATVKEVTLSAFSHQQLPFAQLVEAFQPQRDLRRNPLYQATFQLLSSRIGQARLEAVLPEIGSEHRHLDVDLAFDVLEAQDGFYCRIEYVQALFRDESIARILVHWQRLLAAVARDPDLPLGQVQLLSPAERDRVLNQWSGVEESRALPPERNVAELLDAVGRRNWEHPAILGPEMPLSYGEVAVLSDGVAVELARRGVRPGDVVALQTADSSETAWLILGVWKAGAAYVYLAPELPADRVELILADAAPVLILSDSDPWWRQSPALLPQSTAPIHAAGPESLAAVIYTSGTAGRPKGVALEHRALLNQVQWLQQSAPLTVQDRVLQKYSYSFDAALAELLSAWSAGAPIVTTRAHGSDLDELVRLVRMHQVTVLDLFPSILALLLEHPDFESCRSLRRVVCGGERLRADLVNACLERLPVEFLNLYGPTEATITATWHRCVPSPADPPIGRPILNTEVYVLDHDLQPVPIGVPGQLFLGGAGLARGYLNDAELTNARFVRHPFSPESNRRLYATGDRARFLENGLLEFLGRMDHQLKVRGFRVEPEEIEHVLSAHPAVREAAVGLVQVPAVRSDQAELYLSHLESMGEAEANYLAQLLDPRSPVRHQSMQHKSDQFDLYLHLTNPPLFPTLQEHQRNWWLRRTLQETAENLLALGNVASRAAPGSERPEIATALERSPAVSSADQLLIQGQQVMQRWELPLMRALAEIATETHGHVLEVGFGMGLSASLIQEAGVRSHTLLENHPDVVRFFEKWQSRWPDSEIRLVPRRWQDWEAPSDVYDAVLFDTYPTSEEEYTREVLESPTFAASFFPTACRVLRPGGVFTYYSNEIDSLSREHQRLLLRHFKSFSVTLVPGLRVPPDCQYWWADSMVAVRAVK